MKAIILKGFGSVNKLQYQDIPTPRIKRDEVLVKVKAISINPVDTKVRAGGALIAGPLIDHLMEQSPIILGWDISGEVVEVGNSVLDLKVGDEVFGMVNFIGHGRAYAEYVAAPASHLALKPANVSHEEAAAATLAALTAWQALTTVGKLKADDKMLIHGGSGGVGHYAVQMAKHLGAYVIATSSAGNKDFVLSIGADEHIDYRKHHFEKAVTNLDFVLETMGDRNLSRSLQVVKPTGTVVTINSSAGFTEEIERRIHQRGVANCLYMSVESNGKDMKAIADLLEQGHVKSHVSHVFDFDKMVAAHLQIETQHTVGKVVVVF